MIVLIVVTFVSSCDFYTLKQENISSPKEEMKNKKPSNRYKKQITSDKRIIDIPISRAMVAKMIALTFNEATDIKTLDREIQFKDTDPTKWYDPYINAVVIQGFMNGTDIGFEPLESLTMEQANILLQRIFNCKTLLIPFDKKNKKEPISYTQWMEAYMNGLEEKKKEPGFQDTYGLVKKNLIVVGTSANTVDLPPWTVGTDQGLYNFTGLVLDGYMDQKIQVLLKGKEIIGVLDVIDENPTLFHTYIVKQLQEKLTIFIGGIERTYVYKGKNTLQTGTIADLYLQQGKVVQAEIYQEEVRGRILRVDGDYIELSGDRKIALWDNIKIYSIVEGDPSWKGKNSLLVGTSLARLIIKDDKVCAAIIDQSPMLSTIRVVLHTTDFKGLKHQNVKLTSSEGFVVRRGGEEISYKGGDVLDIIEQTEWDWEKIPRVYIQSKNPEGKIQIQTMVRGWGQNRRSPEYGGIIEIAKDIDGYTIVNEIDIESYITSVIPSEMPTSYGVEAAKVQAVTARSYGYAQMYANRYHAYGGHVDDSTSCQVYNNTPQNDVSIQAVKETKGEGLTFQGNVISANFFSTSSGYTANSGEVWTHYETQSFPGNTPPYLVSKKQYEGVDFGDMSQEENAERFLKTKDIDSYDKDFRWFRWQVTMTKEELTAIIQANLKERYKAKPKLIKTLDENKIFRIRPIESIGELLDIQVYKRGQGGNIMELVLVGTENTIKIATEYNIRFLLRPKQYIKGKEPIFLTQADGTKIADFSAMPSSFFVMDKKRTLNGQLQSITFYGGGYGHGVGMSQNGVKGMVDKGYTYQQILQHYYPGTEITKIFKDEDQK